ncbi:hypothetical protein D3C79_520120 [compost metagenome]
MVLWNLPQRRINGGNQAKYLRQRAKGQFRPTVFTWDGNATEARLGKQRQLLQRIAPLAVTQMGFWRSGHGDLPCCIQRLLVVNNPVGPFFCGRKIGRIRRR